MANIGSIKGAIKVAGVPDTACFTTFADLINALGEYLRVEIPIQSVSNLIISNVQPGQADRDKPWWRISNSGSFIGIYTYNDGVWSQVLPAPGQVFWLIGDSDNPPAGYSFTAVASALSGPDYTALIAQAVPVGGPPFTYYPALYIGF